MFKFVRCACAAIAALLVIAIDGSPQTVVGQSASPAKFFVNVEALP